MGKRAILWVVVFGALLAGGQAWLLSAMLNRPMPSGKSGWQRVAASAQPQPERKLDMPLAEALSITYRCGSAIIPDDGTLQQATVRVRLNGASPNAPEIDGVPQLYWELYGTGYTPATPIGSNLGPFPREVDCPIFASVGANPVTGPLEVRTYAYVDGQWVLYEQYYTAWNVIIDTTTKPALSFSQAVENCDPLTYTITVQVANQPTSWSYQLLDADGNPITGGTANSPANPPVCTDTLVISGVPGTAASVVVTATNANGTTTETYSPTVPAETHAALSATPSAIAAGGTATLNWSVTGAYYAEIAPGIGGVFEWQSAGSKDGSGSVQVAPTETTTYILTAQGACGNVTAQATVTVESPQTYHAILTPPAIPDNWLIRKAVLVLKAKPSDDPAVNTGLLAVRIYGGPAFTGDRPRRITDARVQWTLAGWTADQWYESPDLSCVLAEMRARGFTTLYLSPCSGSSWYQAYDTGDGTSPKLQVWASLVRSHTSTGGLVLGGSAEVRKPQSSLILNRFTISSTPDVREPQSSLILNRFAIATEIREPAASLILNRFAVATETREPTAGLILNRFAIAVRQSSLILNRFPIRSPQSSLILNRFSIFYPDRFHVKCQAEATGQVTELGVLDADASPLVLSDVPIAPGSYRLWVEREGLFWRNARLPSVVSLVIPDSGPLETLPVAVDLAAEVTGGQTVLTWSVAPPVTTLGLSWGLWYGPASPVSTAADPDDRQRILPGMASFLAVRRQEASELVAIAAIAADGTRGRSVELALPWSTLSPASPPNQTAAHSA